MPALQSFLCIQEYGKCHQDILTRREAAPETPPGPAGTSGRALLAMRPSWGDGSAFASEAAHAAKLEYAALGPGRSLDKLIEQRIQSVPKACIRRPTLAHWSAQFGWQTSPFFSLQKLQKPRP